MNYVKNVLIILLCANLIETETHAWSPFNFQAYRNFNSLCNYVKKHPLQSLVISTAASVSLAVAFYHVYQHFREKDNPVRQTDNPVMPSDNSSALQTTQQDALPEFIEMVIKNKWREATQLLCNGVDVNIQDNKGNTALHHVVLNNREFALRWLLTSNLTKDKVIPDVHNKNNETPLYLAVIKKLGQDNLRFLLDDPDVHNKNNETPLYLAVIKKSIQDNLRFLLDHGANVNARDANGATALMREAQKPQADEKVLKTLIELGADVNTQDNQGQTPLMYAIDIESEIKPNTSTLDLLLEHKAEVNAQDQEGKTALIKASMKLRPNYSVIHTLLQKEADPNIVDNKGKTALINIITNTTMSTETPDIQVNIIDDLLAYGALVSIADYTHQNALNYANTLPKTTAVEFNHKAAVIKKLEHACQEQQKK